MSQPDSVTGIVTGTLTGGGRRALRRPAALAAAVALRAEAGRWCGALSVDARRLVDRGVRLLEVRRRPSRSIRPAAGWRDLLDAAGSGQAGAAGISVSAAWSIGCPQVGQKTA